MSSTEEYVHSVGEPRIIGTFNAAKAQEFAEQQTTVISYGGWVSFHEQRSQLLHDFEVKLPDANVRARDLFLNQARVHVQYLPYLMHDDDDEVDLWHADYDNDIPDEPIRDLMPVIVGSSSHFTEIVCGDIRFSKDIRVAVNYDQYLLSSMGQHAVNDALLRGDAWIYEPEDKQIDGKIIEFQGPNIHRRNQSTPIKPFRFFMQSYPY